MTEQEILDEATSILERRAMYNTKKIPFNCPTEVTKYLQVLYAGFNDGAEHFTVLYLDNKNGLIASETPFHGTVDQAAIYPREIVKRALQLSAACLIFAHNHPSGEVDPSTADIRITERLVSGLKLVDIRVLDHVIVGDNTALYASMAALGHV